jgi:hypothetical protein
LMATAMAMVDCNGNGNGNGQQQRRLQRSWQWRWRRRWQMQWQWPGQGQQWQSEGCIFMCQLQRCGRGNTLPSPPWSQRSVHSPALHHGGDAANVVCSLLRGGVPDSSPWIVYLFFTSTVPFTEQPSVYPPHYSGAQKPCQPIDALPPPLLFHMFAKVSLGGAWIVCLQHTALWHG